MAWYSILPAELETWVARIFIILGLSTILPWAALLLFDVALYLVRVVVYEIPVIGGRARGARRPRAMSLERHRQAQRERERDGESDNTRGRRRRG